MTSDGGPAFPVTLSVHPNTGDTWGGYDGMSMRDYFAAHALTGMLSYSLINQTKGNYHENCPVETAALVAYNYADAMIAERNKQ